MKKDSRKSEMLRRNAALRELEAALDRKLKVEKALVGIGLRYLSVNLRAAVKTILEGEYPIVEGFELNHDLTAALGRALESYPDDRARNADLDELLKKWSLAARRRAVTPGK